MRRPPDFICFIISFNSSSSHPQLGSGEWTGHVALGPSQYIENVGAPPPDTVGEVFDRCSAPVIFVADLVTKSSRTLASELMRNPLLIRDVAIGLCRSGSAWRSVVSKGRAFFFFFFGGSRFAGVLICRCNICSDSPPRKSASREPLGLGKSVPVLT